MGEAKTLVCTGGIGSGKSYVSEVFSALGIPVYYSDRRAKELYAESRQLLEAVAEVAGADIIASDGTLKKAVLASRIFSSGEMLAKVEALVHPAVDADFQLWKESRSADLVLFESAIYLEKPSLSHIADYVLTVTAAEEVRIARVMERDHCAREKALERIANQWSDAQRIEKSDFIIRSGAGEPILPQVIEIIGIIKNGKNENRS